MRTRVVRVVGVLLLAVVCLLGLSTCKPIVYYLAQVCKVHGKVTLAGSAGRTPIGSVEAFVGDYQYSELTNYYGDYELELAAGSWTINFLKDGYEPVSAEVTVSLEEPRVRLDVEMVRIAPPVDLTGYWEVYIIAGGQEFGPDVFYILQTGSELDCARGFTGSISGSTVTIEGSIEENPVVGTGTVSASGNEIISTMSGIPYVPGEVTMRMVRPPTLPFGRLDLEGTYLGEPISVHSDFGLGSVMQFDDEFNDDSTNFRVFYLDNRMEVQVWFSFDGEIPVGEPLTAPDQFGISLWWRDDDGLTLDDPEPADGGTLTLTRYDDSAVAGSFSTSFLGDGVIEGSFNVGWLPGVF